MQNPFETGHIKNYILAYVSVVVIMVLFFIASSLFNDVENVQKKEFYVDTNMTKKIAKHSDVKQENNATHKMKYKLLKHGY
jgi:hypothetical protein